MLKLADGVRRQASCGPARANSSERPKRAIWSSTGDDPSAQPAVGESGRASCRRSVYFLVSLAMLGCAAGEPATDQELNWSFVREFELGSVAGPDALFQVDDWSITVSDDGTFTVLDKGNRRIARFDRDGAFIGAFGSGGRGPAELGYPVAILGPRGDTIRVLDGPSSSYKIFAATGQFLGEEAAEVVGLSREQRLLREATALKREVGHRSGEATVRDQLLLVRRSTDTLLLTELEKPAWRTFRVPECQMEIPIPRLFEWELRWDASDDVVVANSEPGYVIQIFERGRIVAQGTRPIEPDVVSRDLALERIGQGSAVGVAGRRCRLDPMEELDGRGYSEWRQIVSDIRVDAGGWIWVRRHAAPLEDPDRLIIDVFDQDGEYEGTLPDDAPWPAVVTRSGRAVVLEADELDIQTFVVYRVER